jgi:carbonic anhydrase
MPNADDKQPLSPEHALARLIEGNRRFLDNTTPTSARAFSSHMASSPQRPFAIILGCSDSRTPVEILFDEGFGDLFVVRIAGNIVAPSVIGSIEFAASQFGSRLVVVMGHTGCGAVSATVRAIETGRGPESNNIRDITSRIAPHIEALVKPGDPAAVMRDAVRANVRASASHLRHGSRILEDFISDGRLAVATAEYDLETGAVTFFEAPSDVAR